MKKFLFFPIFVQNSYFLPNFGTKNSYFHIFLPFLSVDVLKKLKN